MIQSSHFWTNTFFHVSCAHVRLTAKVDRHLFLLLEATEGCKVTGLDLHVRGYDFVTFTPALVEDRDRDVSFGGFAVHSESYILQLFGISIATVTLETKDRNRNLYGAEFFVLFFFFLDNESFKSPYFFLNNKIRP